MKIAVIGSGYVGTVTGTCLAELGHNVICADVNEKKMTDLQDGKVSFYEEGLSPMIATNLEAGRLEFTTDIVNAVKKSDVVFICVGTPNLPNGKPDMNALTQCVKTVAQGMDGYRLIIEKSTMPIKTGQWLNDMLKQELNDDIDYNIAAVPQFLREGHAIQDFMNPDRIIIGADDQRSVDTIVKIYAPLNAPMLITDINSAELIKHATNAFLATKISFINSIGQICEKTGADITTVARGLGLDNRISPDYMNAGIGYGGIFFPKDINSLMNIAEEYHLNLDLLKAVDVINRYQRISFIEKIAGTVNDDLHGKTVAIWGLAYRPYTDDMRDAPSITVIRGLQKRGAKIKAYDPLASENAKDPLPNIEYCASPYEAAKDADVIAVVTAWNEFSYINFKKLKEESNCRIVVDGRNMYNPERMSNLGYHYVSIGRQEALAKTPASV